MSRSAAIQFARHAASEAWQRFSGERVEAPGICVLKEEKKKTGVYRINSTSAGTSIIAKRRPSGALAFERFMYEEVLPVIRPARLKYFGFSSGPDGEWDWLFLEDAGTETYSSSVNQLRHAAAAWLAELHASPLRSDLIDRLPQRDSGYYLKIMQMAKSTILSNRTTQGPDDRRQVLDDILSRFDLLEANWGELASISNGLSSALIHGDFKPDNIGVRAATGDWEILPFDWAAAAWGPPVTDLAQSQPISPGLCASPDLGAYGAKMRGRLGKTGSPSLSLIANAGTIFRCILAIYWESLSLPFEWIEETVSDLNGFLIVLDQALWVQGFRIQS